ncbi:MAG: transcriptional repressor [Lachnospiraceae bacterium]
MVKYSAQRELIKSYLKSTSCHPTAETVYDNVRQVCTRISLGTVYRNLSLLTELGEIQKISCGDGIERYDWNAEPHSHFFCKMCHSLIDLDLLYMSNLNTLAEKVYNGEIQGHTIQFYGICEDCVKTQKIVEKPCN